MANFSYWQASWMDAGAGLLPGEEHHWVMWGFGYGDVNRSYHGPAQLRRWGSGTYGKRRSD